MEKQGSRLWKLGQAIGRNVAPFREYAGPLQTVAKILGGLLLTIVLISWAVEFYEECNRNGQVPHTTTVNLFMKSNWLVEENVECIGVQGSTAPNDTRI